MLNSYIIQLGKQELKQVNLTLFSEKRQGALLELELLL